MIFAEFSSARPTVGIVVKAMLNESNADKKIESKWGKVSLIKQKPSIKNDKKRLLRKKRAEETALREYDFQKREPLFQKKLKR